MATLQPYSQNASQTAAERLKCGDLVAFPTETVYGLGAHALMPEAVAKIFAAKGRPATDPLIVHVCNLEMTWPLVVLTSKLRCVFETLARAFWPGPLTMIAPAASCVPKAVTAGKDAVGIRWPAHAVACELISLAGIPVAAPSANRFGHVSPTRASHVADDLSHTDVFILDAGPCPLGIESTVVKLVSDTEILVLRRGSVSPEQISTELKKKQIDVTLQIFERKVSQTHKEAMDAPGQLLTHYAPNVPAFLMPSESIEQLKAGGIKEKLTRDCADAVIIDFKGQYAFLDKFALGYADLSVTGNPDEAASNVFELLRWAENQSSVKKILLVDLSASSHPTLLAVADRLFRSASGKYHKASA